MASPGLELDPLIGRHAELARLREQLDRSRLLTLTGPGGSGKTRLVQTLLDERRADGAEAWFVDLSALTEDALIASVVASSLGVAETPGRDAEAALVSSVGTRQVLLGLDNLEQLRGAGAIVGRLLGAAPGLRVVATSRIPLRVGGEAEHPVPTLGLPDSDRAEDVEASPAGALFLARARAIGRLETLDGPTAMDIAALLRRLDGLPLAIELAAARTRVLSPAAILRRLDDPRTLARSGDAADRHRSLEAVLAWSFELLGEEERTVLGLVSVCAGPFDLAMATAVAPDRDVLAALDRLVAHGLVRPESELDGEPQFRLLDTVRSFAAERRTPDETALAFGRLADYLQALLERAAPELVGRDPGRAVARIAAVEESIRVVLDRLETVDPSRAAELSTILTRYWVYRGHWREGTARLERLARTLALTLRVRGRSLHGLAWLTYEMGDAQRSTAAVTEALALAREAHDEEGELNALFMLGETARLNGQSSKGRAILLESLALAERLGDARNALLSRINLGYIDLQEGKLDLARARLLAAVGEAQAQGDALSEAYSGVGLGDAAVFGGEPLAAVGLHNAAVALLRDISYRTMLAWALSKSGFGLARVDRFDDARDQLREAALIFAEAQTPHGATDLLSGAVAWLAGTGRHERAGWAFGAFEAANDAVGVIPTATQLRPLTEELARARRAVGSVKLELAIRSGRETPWLEAITTLIAELEEASAPTQRPRAPLRHGDLTRREVEVLGLVGAGKSDPEIAAALYISPKTASVHVANLKAKLGLASRLEMALRARELGLASAEGDETGRAR